MTAALVTRRLLLVLAACGFAGVFAVFVGLESPGLGIGNFFYLPICLVALATDAVGGALAGLFGAGVFALATVLDPQIPSRDALATGTVIRAVTFMLVGTLVGVFVARNRTLVERLHDHASRDFVTGVANVRAFDRELRERFDRAAVTLVLVDVDGLHRVNEVHGHLAGDAALKRVAVTLVEAVERDDLVARVGGDEFAILTSLAPDQVPELTARLNARLTADELTVTAAALASADAETADQLFTKVDDRLFAAKLVRPSRRALAAV